MYHVFFASLYYILGKEKKHPTAVNVAPLITPVLLVLGLGALFLDLNHKAYFWQLYTTIKIQSPMSWGAWVLMLVTPLSFIWAALNIKHIFPKWDWKFQVIKDLEIFCRNNMKVIAWITLISSVILGIYTVFYFPHLMPGLNGTLQF